MLWATYWYDSSNTQLAARAVIVLAGFSIGFIMHRSRLCFARAFREPFMTAEGDMTKAVILALAIGLPIASLLFQKNIIDPYIAIPPTFWIGSLLGGLIFGIGMIFAGGCASGSLWRMGEGHAKLWVTIFFFSWMGSIASALFKKFKLTSIDETNVESYEMTKSGFRPIYPTCWAAGSGPCREWCAAAGLVPAGALQRINREIYRHLKKGDSKMNTQLRTLALALAMSLPVALPAVTGWPRRTQNRSSRRKAGTPIWWISSSSNRTSTSRPRRASC